MTTATAEATQLKAPRTVPACISAVVLTCNEEKNIENCLASVRDWCQEVFVVDSGSTDETVAICRRYTDRVYAHPYVDHASQWHWATTQLPFGCEWLLLLDADHVVSPDLKQQLVAAAASPSSGVNGYYARHHYFFGGVRMRGFKPRTLKLVRKHKVRVDHSELVDFRIVVDGDTASLSGAVWENNANETSLDFWIDKHQRFSSRLAVEEVLRVSGKLSWSIQPRLFGTHDERMVWLKNRWYRLPLYVRPFMYFAYRYVLRGGFLDGRTGWLYHYLQAFWFRMVIDAKISELREQLKTGKLSLDQLSSTFGHQF